MQNYTSWSRDPLEPISQEALHLPAIVWENLPVWRKQWPEIWYVRLRGELYVFRSPTRGDAIQHDMTWMSSPVMAADSLVNECLLYPSELSNDMSMTDVNGLAEAIWKAAGFRDPTSLYDKVVEYQELIQTDPNQANVIIIVKAFPRLTPDEINEMQPDQLAYHIALARAILGLEDLKPRPEVAKKRAQELRKQPRKATFDWKEDLRDYQAFERP
jgi:hypothetical protein